MNYLEKFQDVQTFIFDVDGVMTDGNLMLLENGRQLRKVNIKDGYAIQRAVQSGYRVLVLSGGLSDGILTRMKYLGVEDIFLGVDNKAEVFEAYARQYDIDPGRVLFMGDDLPDYDLMRLVGLSTCPADAAHEILEIAQYVSTFKGGEGCVRDVIEKVMRLQHKWLPKPTDVAAEHTTDYNLK